MNYLSDILYQFRYFLMGMILVAHPSPAAGNISIKNAWVNQAPPGVNVLAAYITIENNRTTDIELVQAKSVMFEKVEFHLSQIDNGIVSMQLQESITVEAGSVFSFEPGKYHLMLFNPQKPLKIDDSVSLELVLSSGEILQVTASIKRSDVVHSH